MKLKIVVRNRSDQSDSTDEIELHFPKHRIFVDYDEVTDLDLNTVLNKGQICKLINIVDNDKSRSGSRSNTWLKLGYQSIPGSLIVINQQSIRVG